MVETETIHSHFIAKKWLGSRTDDCDDDDDVDNDDNDGDDEEDDVDSNFLKQLMRIKEATCKYETKLTVALRYVWTPMSKSVAFHFNVELSSGEGSFV